MSNKDKTVVIVGAGSTAAIAAKVLAEMKDVHVDLDPDPICEDLRRDKHGKRGKKGKAKKDWMLNRGE